MPKRRVQRICFFAVIGIFLCAISGCGGYKSFEGKADVTCNDGASYRDVTEKEAMSLCAESGGIAGYQIKQDDE